MDLSAAHNAPMEIGRYPAESLRDTAPVYTLTNIVHPVVGGEAIYDGVISDRSAVEHVLAGGPIDYLHDHPGVELAF